ncbi:malonic semialdehyde reductase [Sphingomonas rubra]|uniref:3-hydroxypropanoate dehydrogenase n=1 Tax=Sphingomonas rubra TaxID=634430 RepID=A0A1I5SPE2_9SPHN|nr:malonic semialdehyde reductase [Sphingomonas rubra]SFP72548.1 3-hydroxypropanoate dehydrogenase [Sphingomonas rubra]
MPFDTPIDDAAIAQLFTEGRSYNHYLDRPVEEAQLHVLWDLMKMGPTSANQLPARLVWCVSQEAKDRLAECATGTNGDKLRTAPVSVVIGMDTEFHEHLPELFPHTDAKSWFDGNRELREASAFRNSSLQGGYFVVAARALGLGTGPMSGFDAGAVDKAFFADTPSVRTNFIATLGYGDPASLHDRSPRPAFEKFNRIV